MRESRIVSSGFYFGLLFYLSKRYFDPVFSENIAEIATFTLIGLSALFLFANINNYKMFYNTLLGWLSFATVYLGIILAGTRGLSNDSLEVIEGLSRIILAIFAIWKLSADMRNLTLQIDPYKKERRRVSEWLYGIFYPPRELARLIKVLVFISFTFYLIITGLNAISSTDVNLLFFQRTERLSLNLLFFGVQAPMMMASRASVSKTFSEYVKNIEWAESAFVDNSNPINAAYQTILNSNEISYDAISSNGKHLWLTILLILVLQAYETQILGLDIFQIDISSIFLGILEQISNLIVKLFSP